MTHEERKAFEIEFQEKRVVARDKVTEFKKKIRFVPYITVAFGIAFFILGWHFARVFYKAGHSWLSLACIAAFVVLTYAVYIIAGGITLRSVPVFLKKRALAKKWLSAAEEMEKVEEKAHLQVAYEGDITDAEQRLLKASEAVIEKM